MAFPCASTLSSNTFLAWYLRFDGLGLLSAGLWCPLPTVCCVHYDVAFTYRLPTGAVLKCSCECQNDDNSCLGMPAIASFWPCQCHFWCASHLEVKIYIAGYQVKPTIVLLPCCTTPYQLLPSFAVLLKDKLGNDVYPPHISSTFEYLLFELYNNILQNLGNIVSSQWRLVSFHTRQIE